MELVDIFEAEEGIYVGVKFSNQTESNIMEFIKGLNIKNPIEQKDLHSTVIYSKKSPNKNLKVLGAITEEQIAEPDGMHIFKTRDEKNALVIKLKSEFLKNRHKDLMQEYDLSYDFDEYIPHVTVSYDCGDFDVDTVDVKEHLEELEIVREYRESLNLKKFSK